MRELAVAQSGPTISVQPANIVSPEGQPACLAVTATGSSQLGYVWIKDGVLLPRQTNSTLNFASLSLADVGSYSVVVSNQNGIRISVPALVSVPSARLKALSLNIPQDTNVVVVAAGYSKGIFVKSDGSLWKTDATNMVYSNVRSAAAGYDHYLFITSGGGLLAMGYNASGQLGDGSTTTRSSPRPIANEVVAVSAGYDHSLFLRADGTLRTMGFNFYGQLGNGTAGTTTANPVPVAVADNVVAASAGGAFSMFLKADGTLWAMGYNRYGNFGNGANSDYNPFPLCIGSNILTVACGGYHSLFIHSDKTMWASGRNNYGQLGNNTTSDSNRPIFVASNVVTVAASDYSSFYTTQDGTLWAMGLINNHTQPTALAGDNGVLIANLARGAKHSYMLAVGLPAAAVEIAPPLHQWIEMGLPYSIRPASIKGDGNPLYQWRFNNENIPDATNAVYAIAAAMPTDAGYYSLAISNRGGTAASANSALSLLAPPNSITNVAGRTAHLQVTLASPLPQGIQWKKDGTNLFDNTNVHGAQTDTLKITAITADDEGSYHALITNVYDQIVSRPANIYVLTPPSITSQPTSVTLLSGGGAVFSVTASGTPPLSYCWQKNGTNLVDIPNLSGSCASVLTFSQTTLIDSGEFQLVVTNSYGCATSSVVTLSVVPFPAVATQPARRVTTQSISLHGSVVSGSSPVTTWFEWGLMGAGYGQREPAFAIAPGRHLQHITVAITNFLPQGNYLCRLVASNAQRIVYGFPAVFTSGRTITAWGDNSSGQATVPPGLSNAVSVAAGESHSIALMADGTVKAWGDNYWGQGEFPTWWWPNASFIAVTAGLNKSVALRSDGTVYDWGFPFTYAPSTLTNVIAIEASRDITLALCSNGTVTAWGLNEYGKLNVPTGLSNVVAIAAGQEYCLALTIDGTVTAWGYYPSYPVIVPAGLNSVVSVAAGYNQLYALRSNGSVVSWGKSTNAFSRVTNGISFAAGFNPTCILQSDGRLADFNNSIITLPKARSQLGVVANGRVHSLAVVNISNATPVAFCQTNKGFVGQDLLITLSGTDSDKDALLYRIASLPDAGSLYQWTGSGRGAVIEETNTAIEAIDGKVVLTVLTNCHISFRFMAFDGALESSNAVCHVITDFPAIFEHPASQIVGIGSNCTLHVFALGAPSPSYQWRKDRLPIPGACDASYVISEGQLGDSGNYDVIVANVSGCITSDLAHVSIVALPPTIDLHPKGGNVVVGSRFTLSGAATGSGPFWWQWRKNGVYISSANVITTNITGVSTNAYSIANMQLTDSGAYDAVVTNCAGSCTSSVATLTVGYKPAIIEQPASQIVAINSDVNFRVLLQENNGLHYQWYRNGIPIDGEVSSELILKAVATNDLAVVYVVITNQYGYAQSSNAALSVVVGPAVTKEPIGAHVHVGSNYTFDVSSAGTAPLQYQWFMNGFPLLFATNASLVMTNLVSVDSGYYFVTVSNMAGCVNSSNAILNVGIAPTLCIENSTSALQYGSKGNISSAVTGTLPVNIQWYFQGQSVPGETNREFNISQFTVKNVGQYCVSVSNDYGCVTSAIVYMRLVATNAGSQFPIRLAPKDFGLNPTNFAARLALSGKKIAVGQSMSGASGMLPAEASGSVYILSLSTSEVTLLSRVLTPITVWDGATFGYSLGLSEDMLYAGVPSATSLGWFYGAACLYTNAFSQPQLASAWIEQPAYEHSEFGSRGCLCDGLLAVTKSRDACFPPKAHFYRLAPSGLHEEIGVCELEYYQTLAGIAVSSNRICLVANLGENSPRINMPSNTKSQILTFEIARGPTGECSAIITNSTIYLTNVFGTATLSTTCEQDMVAVGEPQAGATQCGKVSLWRIDHGNAELLMTVYPPDLSSNASFGECVVLRNGFLLVGSPTTAGISNSQGAVYVYRVLGSGIVSLQAKVQPAFPAVGYQEYFGNPIAWDGDTVIVGSSGGNERNGEGGVYVYDTKTITQPNVPFSPYIVSEPISATVFGGKGAVLSCGAHGTPFLSYQWFEQLSHCARVTAITNAGSVVGAAVYAGGEGYIQIPNVNIIGGGGFGATATAAISNGAVTVINIVDPGFGYTSLPDIVIEPPIIPIRDQTNADLAISSATEHDTGTYFVVVTNNYGSVTSRSAVLTVNMPVYITAQPQSQTVVRGHDAGFSVSVSGSPAFSYQWYRSTSAQRTAGARALLLNGFVYGAVITNSGAGYTSPPALQILGGGGSGAVAGAVVSNGCVVAINFTRAGSGYSIMPTIQIDPPPAVLLAGRTNAAVTISGVTTNDAGKYYVIATNTYGSVTSTQAFLAVVEGLPPAITSQPASRHVLVGNPASLVVSATGTPAPDYQWQKDGVNLPAAVLPDYFIATASTNDTGLYLVVVTNGYGSVTSAPASLVVGIPPQHLDIGVAGGKSVTLHMDGTPGFPYAAQTSTNLSPPVLWRWRLTNTTDVNGDWWITVTNLSSPQEFYRLTVP